MTSSALIAQLVIRNQFQPAADTGLFEYVAGVELDSTFSDIKGACDLYVGHALNDKPENFLLSG